MIQPELKVGHFFLRVTLPILIMIALGIYFLHAAVFGFWPFSPLQKNTELPNFTPRPSASITDTTHWKTYTSDDGYVEFQYPDNFEQVNHTRLVSTGGYIEVTTIMNDSEEFINPRDDYQQVLRLIHIAGRLSYHLPEATKDGNCGGPVFQIPHDYNHWIQIKFFSCRDSQQPLLNESSVYEDILNTIKIYNAQS